MGNASHAGEEEVPWAAAHLASGRAHRTGRRPQAQSHSPAGETAAKHAARPRAHLRNAADSPDRLGAAAEYAMTLRKVAGSPPVLDVVRIGHLPPHPVEFKTDSAT